MALEEDIGIKTRFSWRREDEEEVEEEEDQREDQEGGSRGRIKREDQREDQRENQKGGSRGKNSNLTKKHSRKTVRHINAGTIKGVKHRFYEQNFLVFFT